MNINLYVYMESEDFTRINMKEYQNRLFGILHHVVHQLIKLHIVDKINSSSNVRETVNNVFKNFKNII